MERKFSSWYRGYLEAATEAGLPLFNQVLTAFVEGEDGDENYDYRSGITFHTPISNNPWISTEPKLTVPDLADSIGQMLARSASGISPIAPTLMMRSYPTDPATIRTATDMLKDIQEAGQKELETVKMQIAEKQKAQKTAKAQAEAEKKAFEEFKAAQNKTP